MGWQGGALAGLIVAFAIPLFSQAPPSGSPVPLGNAVPALPGKYDFRWEKYDASAAPGGKAFYIFDGLQPVGIGTLNSAGVPEIYAIASGVAADQLRNSFERFRKAKGRGATSLSRVPAAGALSRLRAASVRGTPRVTFDPGRTRVLLVGGTVVEFLPGHLEVRMPPALPEMAPTEVTFDQTSSREIEITLNGKAIDMVRRGPVWDGLKALVLKLAASRAGQAAAIVATATGRPASAPSYLAFASEVEKSLD